MKEESKVKTAEEMTAIKFYKLCEFQIEDLTGSLRGYKVEGFVDGYNFKNSSNHVQGLQSRIAKLENENKRLLDLIDSIRHKVSYEKIVQSSIILKDVWKIAEQALNKK